MKNALTKALVVVISAILLITCAACSMHSESVSSTPRGAISKPTPIVLSENEQISLAVNYVKAHKEDMRYYAHAGIKTISNLEIASATVQSHGIVIVKGNFWGLDDYGTVIGKFIFEWKIVVVDGTQSKPYATVNSHATVTKKY